MLQQSCCRICTCDSLQSSAPPEDTLAARAELAAILGRKEGEAAAAESLALRREASFSLRWSLECGALGFAVDDLDGMTGFLVKASASDQLQ